MERDKGIYMSKNGQFTYQVVSDFLNKKLGRRETAKLLQVRERTVTRLARRIEEKGLYGVIHGNRERSSGTLVPVSADYEGNGKADLAVFDITTTTWTIRNSDTGVVRTANMSISQYSFPSMMRSD